MSIHEGKITALNLAISDLKVTDITERCTLFGIGSSQNNAIPIRLFGKDAIFRKSDFSLIQKDTGENFKINQHILFLHYLQSENPVKPTGKNITFRQLPGGQFYWNPFVAKTIKPLLNFVDNDVEKLKKGLRVFDWEPQNYDNFSAKIHAVGNIYILLIYHIGDDEFPASLDILFDSSISQVFKAEDVSVLSSEICFGIIRS